MNLTRAFLIGAAAAGLMASGAQAADLMAPAQVAAAPVIDNTFSFDGVYAGIYGGATQSAGTWGTVGAVVGVNFSVSDAGTGGVEFEGGFFSDGTTTAYDALAIGHLGVLITNSAMVYGALGAGEVGSSPQQTGWVAGGGVEVAATDALSIRGEVLYGRSFSTTDDGVKGTVGLLWHFH